MAKRKNDGRNMGDNSAHADVLNGTAQRQLRTVIERIERFEEEIAELREGLKEVLAEAKGNGFDTKIVRKVVRIRKMDPAKRAEEESLIDLYMAGIGSIPAFEAAVDDDDPDGVG